MSNEPCPFCGSDAVNSSFIRDGRRVGCRTCGASVHAFEPNAEARAWEKWNIRVCPTSYDFAGSYMCDPEGFKELTGDMQIKLASDIAENCGLVLSRPLGSIFE